MNGSSFIAALLFGLATGLGSGLRHLLIRRRRRGHRARRRTPIGELQPGLARVIGSVRRERDLLKAPATGRPCVAFRLRVQIRDTADWEEVLDLSDVTRFTVVDESGEAKINPEQQFELLLEEDAGTRHWGEDLPAAQMGAVRALLRGLKQPLPNLDDVDVRFQEAALEEGEPVSVYGLAVVRLDPDVAPVAPRAMPLSRSLRGTVENPVQIGDGPLTRETPAS